MEKIAVIKRLQIFMLAFLVSVIISVCVTIISGMIGITLPGIVNMIITILQLATYVLIWVSFAQSKNVTTTRKKYLWLALSLTILTIAYWAFTMATSTMLTAQALNDGVISYTMDQATMTAALTTLPAFKALTLINNGISLILDVIYLGLGITIFLQNKQDLSLAEQEYTEAYND